MLCRLRKYSTSLEFDQIHTRTVCCRGHFDKRGAQIRRFVALGIGPAGFWFDRRAAKISKKGFQALETTKPDAPHRVCRFTFFMAHMHLIGHCEHIDVTVCMRKALLSGERGPSSQAGRLMRPPLARSGNDLFATQPARPHTPAWP